MRVPLAINDHAFGIWKSFYQSQSFLRAENKYACRKGIGSGGLAGHNRDTLAVRNRPSGIGIKDVAVAFSVFDKKAFVVTRRYHRKIGDRG